jgi:hypothetical protein
VQESFRWPSFIYCDHNTRLITTSNVYYTSVSNPPTFTNQIVNCILAPAYARTLTALDMMITYRTGVANKKVSFRFVTVDLLSGAIVASLNTTPINIMPANASLYPVRVWKTLFQASAQNPALPITSTQYFGVIFTGVNPVSQVNVNDLDVRPVFELTLA